MEGDLERILRTVEHISFSAIALFAAVFLINTAMNLGPGTYARSLLNGISIYMILGAVILLLWVAFNVFSFSRPSEGRKKKR